MLLFDKQVNKLVIKIGSSVICSDNFILKEKWLKTFVHDVKELHDNNVDIIIVTSGAVALGRKKLNLGYDLTENNRRLCASVGQVILLNCYNKLFQEYNIDIAQILISNTDINDKNKYLNIATIFDSFAKNRIIPIVNENDTIVDCNNRIGNNDDIAAFISVVFMADMLIILSDVDGVYDGNPKTNPGAKLITYITNFDNYILSNIAEDNCSKLGTGGMKKKIDAIKHAVRAGSSTIIVNGTHNHPIKKLFEDRYCSYFVPNEKILDRRKNWLYAISKPNASLIIDDGAINALKAGNSILPIGIIDIINTFNRDDVVYIRNQDLHIIGRGIVEYDCIEIKKIKNNNSNKIVDILGYSRGDVAIHRDNLIFASNI